MSNGEEESSEKNESKTSSNETSNNDVTGVNPLTTDSFYRDSHDPDHFPKSLLDGYMR